MYNFHKTRQHRYSLGVIMGDLSKSVMVLTIISACSAGFISGVRALTAERIEMQQLIFEKTPALEKILGENTEAAVASRYHVVVNGKKHLVFPSKNQRGQQVVVIESSGKGYSGDIGVMVATETESATISGVAVSSHTETPGIGAEAGNNTDFLSQFTGKHLEGSFQLNSNGGEINAISGATRTSEGIVSAISNSSAVIRVIHQRQNIETE